MLALVRLGIFLVLLVLNGIFAVAAPSSLTYQGRILKSDGTPLEYSNVSFQFEITSPDGLCVVYREQTNGINMVNSGGVFDVPIGLGTQSFPGNGTFTLLDAFNNTGSLNCDGSSTYSPQFDDVRRLRVKFFDGTGWQTISPDSTVRSVPYAGFSYSAAKLGTNSASDFVLKIGLPTCTSGTFLSWDGSNMTCAGVAGASGGTVTNVTSANSYLTIVNSTSTPQLTLNVGTTANTVAAGNDPRLLNAIQTGSAASGDLSGTYPGPTVVALQGVGISTAVPTSGQFLKFDGTNWTPATLPTGNVGTITALTGDVSASGSGSVAATVNSVGGSAAANIHSAELLANAATNANTASTVVKRDASGNFSAGTVTASLAGAASLNVLKAGDSMSGNLIFGANVGNIYTSGSGSNTATIEGPSGAVATSYVLRLPTAQGAANQVMMNDGSGNLSWTNLSAGSLTGTGTAGYLPYYTAASTLANSSIYYNGTNVGIGTTSPVSALQIGNAKATTDYGVSLLISGNAGTPNSAGSARVIWEDRNNSTSSAAMMFGGNTLAIGSISQSGGVWNNASIMTVNTSNYTTTFGGNVTHIATTGDVYTADTGGGTVTLQGPSSAIAANYVLRLPTAQGTANQVLANDGSGNLSWTTPSTTATSYSGVLPVANGGTNSSTALNNNRMMVSNGGAIVESSALTNGQLLIGSTGAAPVVANLTAGSGISITNGAGSISIAATGLQSSTLSDGKILVGNSSNVATAQTPSGDLTMADTGAFTVAKIQGTSVSATAPSSTGQVLRWNGTSWAPNFVSMFDLRSTVTGTQAFGGVGCTAGQTLTWTAATDNLSCTDIAITGSQVTYSSQTANTFFAAPNGSTGAPTFRNIVAADLPTSGVTAGTYKSVTVDAYGRVTAATNPTTASGYGITDAFVNGGNSFGAAANLGTNDSNVLNLKTNNATVMTLSTSGKVGIGTTSPGSLNSTDALTIYKANSNIGESIISDNTSTNTARYPAIMVMNFMGSPGTGSGGNPSFNMLNSRGSSSSPAAMKSGESLGAFVFNGASDTSGNYIEGAAIWAMTTQAYTSSAAGTMLQFYTTANNTNTAVPRVTIDQSGYLGVGTQSPVSMLQVGGSALSQASWTTQGSHLYIPGVTSTDTTGSGTIAARTVASIGTHTFAASSSETITNASTMYLAGAPSAGTNVTITNPLALHVGAGNSAFMGNVGIGTTSPNSPLQVQGNIASIGSQASTTVSVTNDNGTSSAGNYPKISVTNFKGTSSGFPQMTLTNYGGSGASPSAVAAGDILGNISVGGANGSGYNVNSGAQINFTAYDAFSTTDAATDISFLTAPTGSVSPATVMTISHTGAVGINSTSPTTKLYIANSSTYSPSTNALGAMTVQGSFGGGIILQDGTYSGVIYTNNNGANLVFAAGGTSTGSPSASMNISSAGNLVVSGCVAYNGGTSGTCLSDRRLKKDIRPFDLGLDKVLGLNPVFYKYNGLGGNDADTKDRLGVIAQEVEKVAPELVETRQVKLHRDDKEETTVKVVNYNAFTYMLINAMKEFYHQFTDTKSEVAGLKRDIASLKDENAALKAKEEKAQKENAEIKARLERIEKSLNSK